MPAASGQLTGALRSRYNSMMFIYRSRKEHTLTFQPDYTKVATAVTVRMHEVKVWILFQVTRVPSYPALPYNDSRINQSN